MKYTILAMSLSLPITAYGTPSGEHYFNKMLERYANLSSYVDKGVSRTKYTTHVDTTIFTTLYENKGDYKFTWSSQPDEFDKQLGIGARHNKYYKNDDGIFIQYAHSATPEKYPSHFHAIGASAGVSYGLVLHVPRFLVDNNNLLPLHGSDSAEILNINEENVTLKLVMLGEREFTVTIDLTSYLITRYTLRDVESQNPDSKQVVEIKVLSYE